jgi:uncharacterized repeat protein (TIGR01451 family)
VAFQIRITNPLAKPVRHIVVRDQLPAGLRHPQGDSVAADIDTLEPGAVRTIRLETVAVGNGQQINEVSVRGDDVPEATARTVVLVTEPALKVQVQAPRQATLGQDLDFQVEVANGGQEPGTDVRLIQVIPDGLEFLTASTGGTYNPATHAISWTLGTLAGGQRQVVRFLAHTRLAGDWALPAAVSAQGVGESRATSAIHIEDVPSLTLEVVARDERVSPGGDTTCEVRVFNRGPGPCSRVSLSIRLPEELVALSGDGPTSYRIQGSEVVFEPLAQLGARIDAVYHLRVRGRPLGPQPSGPQPAQWLGLGRLRVQLQATGLHQPITRELAVPRVAP